MKIRTGNALYARFGGYRKFIEQQAAMRWGITPNWSVDPAAPPLPAFVVRSDWVVKCECNEQIAIEPGEPFWCPNCCNAKFAGSRQVIWPNKAARGNIETLLLKRIYPQNRNWLPGETTKQLAQENAAHPEAIK